MLLHILTGILCGLIGSIYPLYMLHKESQRIELLQEENLNAKIEHNEEKDRLAREAQAALAERMAARRCLDKAEALMLGRKDAAKNELERLVARRDAVLLMIEEADAGCLCADVDKLRAEAEELEAAARPLQTRADECQEILDALAGRETAKERAVREAMTARAMEAAARGSADVGKALTSLAQNVPNWASRMTETGGAVW